MVDENKIYHISEIHNGVNNIDLNTDTKFIVVDGVLDLVDDVEHITFTNDNTVFDDNIFYNRYFSYIKLPMIKHKLTKVIFYDEDTKVLGVYTEFNNIKTPNEKFYIGLEFEKPSSRNLLGCYTISDYNNMFYKSLPLNNETLYYNVSKYISTTGVVANNTAHCVSSLIPYKYADILIQQGNATTQLNRFGLSITNENATRYKSMTTSLVDGGIGKLKYTNGNKIDATIVRYRLFVTIDDYRYCTVTNVLSKSYYQSGIYRDINNIYKYGSTIFRLYNDINDYEADKFLCNIAPIEDELEDYEQWQRQIGFVNYLYQARLRKGKKK